MFDIFFFHQGIMEPAEPVHIGESQGFMWRETRGTHQGIMEPAEPVQKSRFYGGETH